MRTCYAYRSCWNMMSQGAIWLLLLFLVHAGGAEAVAQSDEGLSFQGLGADGSYALTINQNYLAGAEITQVQCTGGDDGNSATNITYSILNSGNLGVKYFDIHADSGVVVLQNDALSFPAEFADYSATVVCESLRDAELRDVASLTVMYAPENEHAPIFDHNGTVEISVPEDRNFTANPQLVILNATDDDLGEYGQIFYSLVGGNEEGAFTIDLLTGSITTTAALDYERSTDYWLTVGVSNRQVCDDITPQTKSVVHIAVVDIDDEPLKFTQSIYNITLNETTTESMQQLVTLSCFDPDTNTFVVYNKRFLHQPFNIDPSSGTVTAIQPLDYEQQRFYSLTFDCTDLNSHRNVTALVNITVLPVNEHRPEAISRAQEIAVIAIDTPPGTLIATGLPVAGVPIRMEFIDRDLGPNLEHDAIRYTYATSNTDFPLVDQHFHLDSETGNLTLIARFQISQCSAVSESLLVRISLTACDIEELDECPNVQLLLYIHCLPSFPADLIQIHVSESSAIGSILETIPCAIPGAVEAEDKTVFISATDGDVDNETAETFHIDQDGSLYLREKLDYEWKQSYGFMLQCWDSRTGRQVSTTVEVFVLPENDNRPFFQQSLFIFNVTDLVTTESVPYAIGTLQAHDNDLDRGSNLSFSITSANSPQFSIMQTHEATVILNELPNDPFSDTFVVEVELSDGLYSTTATVIILIDRRDEIRKREGFESVSDGNQSNENGLYVAIGLLTALSLFLAVIATILAVSVCYYHRSLRELAGQVDTEQSIKLSSLDRRGSVDTEACPAYRTTSVQSHQYSSPDEQELPHEAHYHYVTTPHLHLDGKVANNSTSPLRGSRLTPIDHTPNHTPSHPPLPRPPPLAEATGSRMETEDYVHMQGSLEPASVRISPSPSEEPQGKNPDGEVEGGKGVEPGENGEGQEGEGEREDVVSPIPLEYELPRSVNTGAAAKENIYERIQ